MMKKKLTLLIFLFPLVIMAQDVKNGAIIFDMSKNKREKLRVQDSLDRVQDSIRQNQPLVEEDEDEQQKTKKQKKVREPQGNMMYTAADYKREGLFKAWFHAGINGSQIDGDNFNGYNQIGLDAGVGALIRFHKYLAFSMSLDYSMKGARQQLRQDPNSPTLSKYQVQWDYVEVPLLLHVMDKDIIMFGLGLQPAIMVRYKEIDENDYNVTNNPPGGQPSRFDLEGIAYLHFLVKKQITFGIKFSYSAIKIRGSLAANRLNGEYNNILTFDVGYILRTVKKAK